MIQFFVPGIPAPKGSARAFYIKKLGRSVITNANAKTKPWEATIRAEASGHGCKPDFVGEVHVEAIFHFTRPKGHYGKRGLRDSAPAANTKKPDIDKLARTLLDALTGVAFIDDAQVTQLVVSKRYVTAGGQPGVTVTIHGTDAREGVVDVG